MNPHEELLSAYLDGELSPDEKASAEALLATNPEARRFYDELVALRTAIKALPRREVSPELVRRVMERTEQELAKGKTSSAAAQVADTRVELPPPTDVEPAPWRPLRSWRAVFWPVAVLAAAIFVMVYQENPPGNEVAKSVPEAAATAPDRKSSGEDRFGGAATDGEIRHNGDLWSKDHELGAVAAPKSEAVGDSKSGLGRPGSGETYFGDATVDASQVTQRDMGARVELVKEQLENGNTPPGLIVINCNVTPQAAKEGTLEKVLADNKISIDATSRGLDFDGDGRDLGQGEQKTYAYTRSAKLPEPVGQEVDAYYVELPYDQLQATVAEFNRRSDEIRAVEVESNPSTPPALVSMNRGGAVEHGGEGQNAAFGANLGKAASSSVPGDKTEASDFSAAPTSSSAYDVDSKSDSLPAAKAPAKAEGEVRQERMQSYAKKGVPKSSESDKEESNRPATDPVAKGQLQQAAAPERKTSLSPRELEELKQKESLASKQGGRQPEGIENSSRAARFKYNAIPPLTRGREQAGATLFSDPTNDLRKQTASQENSPAANESRRGSGLATQRFDKSGAPNHLNGSADGAAPALGQSAAQEPAVAQEPTGGRQVASSPPLRVLIRQFVVSADDANKVDSAKSKAAIQAPAQEVAPATPAQPAAPQKALNDAPQPRPSK